MNKPKFSIVIPVYLRESEHKAVVEDCIDSFCQNYKEEDVELIIVDDGSPLPSGFLKDRAGTYVRQSNQGISRAWNVGKWLAKGEYVLIANDDIRIAPGLLETLCKGFDDEKTGVVAPQSGGPNVEPCTVSGPFFENHKFYPGYCFMLKRDRFFEDFDEQFKTNCGDTDYWLGVIKKGLKMIRAPVAV